MSLFVVRYDYRDGSAATRDKHRPAHRAFLGSQASLRVSGPTADGGGVLVFEEESAEALQAMLDQDPFWTLDTIERRRISAWTPVSGPWLAPLGLA